MSKIKKDIFMMFSKLITIIIKKYVARKEVLYHESIINDHLFKFINALTSDYTLNDFNKIVEI